MRIRSGNGRTDIIKAFHHRLHVCTASGHTMWRAYLFCGAVAGRTAGARSRNESATHNVRHRVGRHRVSCMYNVVTVITPCFRSQKNNYLGEKGCVRKQRVSENIG